MFTLWVDSEKQFATALDIVDFLNDVATKIKEGKYKGNGWELLDLEIGF